MPINADPNKYNKREISIGIRFETFSDVLSYLLHFQGILTNGETGVKDLQCYNRA